MLGKNIKLYEKTGAAQEDITATGAEQDWLRHTGVSRQVYYTKGHSKSLTLANMVTSLVTSGICASSSLAGKFLFFQIFLGV